MRILSLKDGTLRIAAANDDEVNEVIVSAGTWVKWFEPSKEERLKLIKIQRREDETD